MTKAPKGPPLPSSLAKSGSEEAEQTALFAWAAMNAAHCGQLRQLFFAIPNGGSRGDDAQTRQIRGGKLIAQGVRPGVCDTFLAVARQGFHGLFIEMKRDALRPVDREKHPFKGCSEEQLDFIVAVREGGYAAAVCYGWREAAATLCHYLEIDPAACQGWN